MAPGAGFMEDNFSTDGGGGIGMVQVVMPAMGSNGAQLPLTSCCVARVVGVGDGDPCSKLQITGEKKNHPENPTQTDLNNKEEYWLM